MWLIDVWFQIDVHCVSVRAVNKRTKIALMASSIVFCVSLSLHIAGRTTISRGLEFLTSYLFGWYLLYNKLSKFVSDYLPFYLYLAMGISAGIIIGIFLNAIIATFFTKK